MPAATPSQVRAQTHAVIAHHRDDSNPQKPLWLLIPGGGVAVCAFIYLIVAGLSVATQQHAPGEPIPFPFQLLPPLLLYFGGLFIFSYGYDLYDWKKALRRTILWGLIGLAAIVAIVAIGFALSALLGGRKGSRSTSSSKTSSSSKSFGAAQAFGSTPSRSSGSIGGGQIIADVARTIGNVAVHRSSGGMAPSTNLSLGQTAPGTCSFCSRPLPTKDVIWPDTLASAEKYCPKCGQPFEPAGAAARG